MRWQDVFLHEGDLGRRHRPLTVEVGPEHVCLVWPDGDVATIPLERILWVSESPPVCGCVHEEPQFVTILYEEPDGRTASVTLGGWWRLGELVAEILRAREASLARGDAELVP